jgi:hypothetical protein
VHQLRLRSPKKSRVFPCPVCKNVFSNPISLNVTEPNENCKWELNPSLILS